MTFPGETERVTLAKSKVPAQFKQQVAQWEFHNGDKIEWVGSSRNLDNMFPDLTKSDDNLLKELVELELDGRLPRTFVYLL